MSCENSNSSHVAVAVFTSDLSLDAQKEQLVKFISDYSERLLEFDEGMEREIICARLARLEQDLKQVEDALETPA